MKRIAVVLATVAMFSACTEKQVVVGVGPSVSTVIKSELFLLGNPQNYEVVRTLGGCEGMATCSFRLQGNMNYRVLVSADRPSEVSAVSNVFLLVPEGLDGKTASWRFHIVGEKSGPYWIKLSSGRLVQTLNISVF